MIDIIINTPFTCIVVGPDNVTVPNAAAYIGGSFTSTTPITVHQKGSNSNLWNLTFTPTTPGLYTVIAFGAVQFRAQCYAKSLATMLANVEDEALGSWEWDKATGNLTLYRQSGATLGTYKALDTLTNASREKLS